MIGLVFFSVGLGLIILFAEQLIKGGSRRVHGLWMVHVSGALGRFHSVLRSRALGRGW
jgi:hypothetical protein